MEIERSISHVDLDRVRNLRRVARQRALTASTTATVLASGCADREHDARARR